MSDRLALANAIEDAGIDRSKAQRVASVIFDALHNSVATKADVQTVGAEIKAEIAGLRSEIKTEMHSGFARQDVAIERLRSSGRELESRITLRLGGLIVVLLGLLFTALHYWPPHG